MVKTSLISASKVASLLFCLLVLGCKNDDVTFDLVPRIEFESYELIKSNDGKDSVIELKIYFEDGDGDVGLDDTDINPPFNFGGMFYHNLPITFLEWDGTTFIELQDPITNQPYGNKHERLPLLNERDKVKSINGTISASIPAKPSGATPSKVKFEIALIDRALNISNTVFSPEIDLVH